MPPLPTEALACRFATFGLAFAASLLGSGGCVDSIGSDSGILHPTLVAVAPEDFLNGVPCADAPGAMRRYVATLYDVSEGLGADDASLETFALPSSGPIDCRQTTGFGFVVPGHRYVARVDGYDRADIQPLGSGSPVMLASDTGEFVAPRWTTRCTGTFDPDDDSGLEGGLEAAAAADVVNGDTGTDAAAEAGIDAGSGDANDSTGLCAQPDPLAGRRDAVMSIEFVTRRVSACKPLCDGTPGTATGLSVRIDPALGSFACGTAPGQIASFRVTPCSPSTPSSARCQKSEAPRSAACGESIDFLGLVPGQSYSFEVTAFEAGASSPGWGTLCRGLALAGAVAQTSCDPLAATGSLVIDVSELLGQMQLSCSDLGRLTASLPAQSPRIVESGPPSCNDLRFTELEPAFYSADVVSELGGDAGTGPRARCEALVSPGSEARAVCSVFAMP